jgi:hypothetical protein
MTERTLIAAVLILLSSGCATKSPAVVPLSATSPAEPPPAVSPEPPPLPGPNIAGFALGLKLRYSGGVSGTSGMVILRDDRLSVQHEQDWYEEAAPQQLAEAERLFGSIDWNALAVAPAECPLGEDLFSYTVEASTPSGVVQVRTWSGCGPPELARLLALLHEHAAAAARR